MSLGVKTIPGKSHWMRATSPTWPPGFYEGISHDSTGFSWKRCHLKQGFIAALESETWVSEVTAQSFTGLMTSSEI